MISFFFFLFSFSKGNRFSPLQRHKKEKRVAETGFTLSCYSFHFDYFDFRGESQEKEGKLLIVAPDDITGLKTLTKDKEILKALYRKGLADARAISDFIAENKVR